MIQNPLVRQNILSSRRICYCKCSKTWKHNACLFWREEFMTSTFNLFGANKADQNDIDFYSSSVSESLGFSS